jgi:hypothetical protein
MIREVPRYTQIDLMFQDIILRRTARTARLVRIWISVLRNALVTGGVSFAYLLTKRFESITLFCLGGQVGRVDSVGIVLCPRSLH